MKTFDGYEIEVGMWLSDDTGIYEVVDIGTYYVELVEIICDDVPEKISHGGHRFLLPQEIKKMKYLD